MNERILELYKQAHVPNIAIDPSNNMHYQTTSFSAEKFAQLIVRECATVGFLEADANGDLVEDSILTHFGVE